MSRSRTRPRPIPRDLQVDRHLDAGEDLPALGPAAWGLHRHAQVAGAAEVLLAWALYIKANGGHVAPGSVRPDPDRTQFDRTLTRASLGPPGGRAALREWRAANANPAEGTGGGGRIDHEPTS